MIPAESDPDSPLSHINSWQIADQVISKSKWWQIFLITIGSASSIIYPHVPLVGFAAVAGNTSTTFLDTQRRSKV